MTLTAVVGHRGWPHLQLPIARGQVGHADTVLSLFYHGVPFHDFRKPPYDSLERLSSCDGASHATIHASTQGTVAYYLSVLNACDDNENTC